MFVLLLTRCRPSLQFSNVIDLVPKNNFENDFIAKIKCCVS